MHWDNMLLHYQEALWSKMLKYEHCKENHEVHQGFRTASLPQSFFI